MNNNRMRLKRNDSGENTRKKGPRKKLSATPPENNSTLYRTWTRIVLMGCVLVVAYFYAKKEKETKFAVQREIVQYRFQKLSCSESYLQEIAKFPKCVPTTCGRYVTDTLVDERDVDILLEFALTGLKLGGSSGGASIFDLHSGALSKGENFISIFRLPEAEGIFKKQHIDTFMSIKDKIMQLIAEKFMLDQSSLFLTHPTFFSRINNVTAKTIHDEYWHPHVDKETYKAFYFTSLLYLTDYGKDFSGGRFIFVDGQSNNKTEVSIEPKRGRLSLFTSGGENLHFVEKVTSGVRYAITISFTCDPEHAVHELKFEI